MPPGRPVIYNERGIIVETNLGPYNEGVELILTCSVSGGKQNFQYCILWSLIFQDDPATSLNPPRDLVCLGQTQFVVLHVKDETECMQVYNLQTIQHLVFLVLNHLATSRAEWFWSQIQNCPFWSHFMMIELSNSFQEGRKTARKSRKLDYFGDCQTLCLWQNRESKSGFYGSKCRRVKTVGVLSTIIYEPERRDLVSLGTLRSAQKLLPRKGLSNWLSTEMTKRQSPNHF